MLVFSFTFNPFCFTVLYNCLLTTNLYVLAIKHKLFSYLVILVMF